MSEKTSTDTVTISSETFQALLYNTVLLEALAMIAKPNVCETKPAEHNNVFYSSFDAEHTIAGERALCLIQDASLDAGLRAVSSWHAKRKGYNLIMTPTRNYLRVVSQLLDDRETGHLAKLEDLL